MVAIRQVIEGDIEYLARIYMESFPDNTRTLVGPKTCQSYFKNVMHNPAYVILVATYHKEIAGFVVIHLDLSKTLGRRWFFASGNELIRFVIKRYGYVMKCLIFPLINPLRKKKTLTIHKTNKNPSIEKGSSAWLELIAVKKDLRRKKIAQHLLESALTLVRQNGNRYLKITVLKSDEPAIKLYEVNGAQKFAERIDLHILYIRLVDKKSGDEHLTQ